MPFDFTLLFVYHLAHFIHHEYFPLDFKNHLFFPTHLDNNLKHYYIFQLNHR